MALKEGSIIPVNLRCGCRQVSITLLNGEQRVRCPDCGKDTLIEIRVNSKGDVERVDTKWN
jgi:hypothetical protein